MYSKVLLYFLALEVKKKQKVPEEPRTSTTSIKLKIISFLNLNFAIATLIYFLLHVFNPYIISLRRCVVSAIQLPG